MILRKDSPWPWAMKAHASQTTFLFTVICGDLRSSKQTFSWAVVNVKFNLVKRSCQGFHHAFHIQGSAATLHLQKPGTETYLHLKSLS